MKRKLTIWDEFFNNLIQIIFKFLLIFIETNDSGYKNINIK